MIWQSTNPNDYIDLYPLVGEGEAVATNGRYVAGLGAGTIPAFVWDSQTNEVTDLRANTPSGYYTIEPWAVDAVGNIIGETSTIRTGLTYPSLDHASEWLLVPEPTSLSFIALAFGAAASRSRPKRVT